MTFQYEHSTPWGRSYNEYRRMFQLTNDDLQRRILGCADGPASFNAQMARRGRRVVSCDPLYQLTANQIEDRIADTYEDVLRQTSSHLDQYVWNEFKTPEELGRARLEAKGIFLADYDQGKREERYRPAELPELPFECQSFDLALCSHFLFLHSDSLTLAFHKQAIDELCRVAREVRVFPLLTDTARPSPLVEPVTEHLRSLGRWFSFERVPYELQRGGNYMLRVVPAG